MLLELEHTTDLRYSDLISESVMELRVTPRQESDQFRLSFDLSIGPPTSVTSYFDWQGNTVHSFAINRFHNQIRIVATSIVETDRKALDLDAVADRWPLTPTRDHQLYDYLAFAGPVVDDPRLREVVRWIEPREGEPVGGLLRRALHVVQQRFEYQKGITTAASPITDILEHGKGVCQDFTHLAIGLLRAMRIPARYVSGLIHEDQAHHLRGAAQTHAWCEALLPSVGWVGLDPTNDCVVDANFVKVAVGRHFADVSPNRGVFKGQAVETIDVRVLSRRLAQVPPELAGERLGTIDIPAFPAGSERQRQLAKAAMAHQQQQQQQ